MQLNTKLNSAKNFKCRIFVNMETNVSLLTEKMNFVTSHAMLSSKVNFANLTTIKAFADMDLVVNLSMMNAIWKTYIAAVIIRKDY